MSTSSRTPSPSSLSACGGPSSSTTTAHPSSSPKSKTSVTSSRSDTDSVIPEHKPSSASSFSIGRLLFRSSGSSNSTKRDSVDSGKDDETGRSPATSRPGSPNPGGDKSPQMSTSRRLAGFASRSIRKSQWRLFKHRTFFGSQRSSMKKNQLQLPRLTLRHPSIDSSAMPLQLDVDENASGEGSDDFLQIRRSTQRRWTDSDTTGRLRDSRDSSDFNDSHDTLDIAGTSAHGVADSSSHHHHNYSMTAPVSPNVPLSASSSHSEGWKYSSQKLLWKLKPKYAYSHASSTSSSTDSAWKSLDSMTWRSVDGAEVVLRGARLENLSEIERSALQLLAAQRLTKMLPGVNLGKPKALRQKRQKLVKSNRTPTVADVQRRASGTPMPEEKRVFGVSLAMCMLNEKRLDQESRCRSLDDSTVIMLNKSKAKPTKSEPEMMSHTMPEDRKWLYPSTQNLYPTSTSNPSSPSPIMGSAPPTGSILPSANLLSAEPTTCEPQQVTGRFLKKQRPASASFSCSLDANIDDVDPHALQVPKIVENCTQYLMTYGLTQVGLFRVAGNTKRCRQLRNALEKVGGGAVINDNMVENTTSHDVATLLKEYFRDLPQSLLPGEHYSAYIGAASRFSQF
ncbi:Rho-GAP domain-containing protein [Caenorhabditis elegans]|uniref:Rho-GAP domain-containing protein n=1 Tax=Caenorhabditis elegans TaxID=6239 RepID=H2KYD2_CAEEL|nr:Rho-GAP domain-containing protein [Caenorhabditis elegans]CCD62430.1 Rho-GAP domain-containing protein [Caenorhabditis elegans]|eukprot:NP_491466.2 Rho GTPase Activating protein [Caenorhabditis elegans]